MARAVAVFRTNAVERAALTASQEEAEKARARRMQRIEELIARFERSVADVLAMLTASAARLEATARTVIESSASAAGGVERSATAATAARDGAQAVFEATDQLSAAIAEIGGEVTKSTGIAHEAVATVEDTTARVRRLADSIHQIRDIVDMIDGIASQTNLLALNASIEAARAGEAGKGFAVVANEVKALATQTGAATKDIHTRIGAIKQETEQTVEAVQAVRDTIGRMDHALTTIAAAVEEQDASTRGIASNSQSAATGARSVAANIDDLAAQVRSVDKEGHGLGDVVADLGRQAKDLRDEVARFLEGIKSA